MLTKTQRLEIESRVLREALENIRKELEELDRVPLKDRYSGRAVPKFLGHITAEVGHVQDTLKFKLESEECNSRKTPATCRNRGKSKKISVSSL